MAVGLQQLVRQAKELRIPSSLIRANMGDAAKLTQVIESFQTGKAHHNREVKMAPRAKAKAKAKVTKRKPAITLKKKPTKPVARKAPVKRGRPAGKSKTAVRKAAISRKPQTTRRSRSTDAGRHMIGRISFTKTDGWNPRDGSVTSIIFKSLKKHKGDRDRVFAELKSSIRSLIPGTYTKQARETALRYRISRTLWDFAVNTGQHDKSENRAEYGTAGTGNGTRSKPARKAAVKKATRKPAAVTKRRGRPPGSKTKTTTAKARTTAVKRGPGRPKGSKNRPKARR